MKKFLFLFLFVAVTCVAFGQIRKGQYLIGGSIRFESENQNFPFDNTYKSNDFFISPAVGYFFLNKLAVGLRMDFSSTDSKSDTIRTHFTSTTISPFIRYYLLPAPKKVNAFIDVGYVHTKTKWVLSNSSYDATSKGFQISAGPSIFLTDQIALEFTLGFRHTKADESAFEPSKSNTISTGFGLQIHLGKLK